MARIRRLQIQNFRSIQNLDWIPSPGFNCLIGPGDSGKSSILDAIDVCLGARRNAPFGDTDFYQLDVSQPILITVTLGGLPDDLINLDSYGDFLRGFDHTNRALEDEPRFGIETVLTLQLKVESDLEPSWRLFSDRASQQGIERSLAWKDRARISPARIGSYANTNLSWSRSSILNRLTEERPALGGALAEAARDARNSFGVQAGAQLQRPLEIVTQTANYLGVPVGAAAQALLDAHAVSIGDGAIALHNDQGIPLRSLGTGSSRLLVAGLQRQAAQAASIALVDEVEYGLEPHRLIRFMDSLGAKNIPDPLQVFLTTHSPVALRELSGHQLFVVRPRQGHHQVLQAGISDDVQSTLRIDPEAFLAKRVVVCEGASEVGLMRGLDQYWGTLGRPSFLALGGAYVNVNGGSPDNCYTRGSALLSLGYQVLVIVDADKPVNPAIQNAFHQAGGQSATWGQGRALEDELFACLPDTAIDRLLEKAIEVRDRDLVADHIRDRSQNTLNLQQIEAFRAQGVPYAPGTRSYLGLASRIRKNGWFKSVTTYEFIAKQIIGPHLQASHPDLHTTINRIRDWIHAA
ncbi:MULTISPECIES: ATP-dependent nuclease [Pseudomonas]|uniref:ATP-dependent nuclease n=1 Tax=Pseudomonas TaxID=286 RepID=UPI000760DA04|nr:MULTISPECIES: ATP-binding protein [Pseudomonas]RXT62627.1 ATP-dependent endonuclease [Pseudomonas syringae]RXT98101.1 ATP-dependent endonuclease [Pseudomonas syringae]